MISKPCYPEINIPDKAEYNRNDSDFQDRFEGNLFS